MKVNIKINAHYYLKLIPSSFMKSIQTGKGNHAAMLDIYSKHEDMLKHGWTTYASEEEMENAALPYDTSPDMKGMRIKPEYTLSDPK